MRSKGARTTREGPREILVDPGVTEHGNLKGLSSAGRIEEFVMHAVQGEIGTAGVGNLATIGALQRMTTPKHVVHMTGRGRLVRAAVERDNPAQTAVCISAVGLAMCNVVNPIADVSITAVQAILEIDRQCLGRAVAPGLVVGHARVANVDHGAIARVRVGLAPVPATETAFRVLVDLAVDAVQAMRAIEPAEVVDRPCRDGTTFGRGDGARSEGSRLDRPSGHRGGERQHAGQDG